MDTSFNDTINRPKGCNFIKKETLAQMKFLGTTFCIERFLWATAFALSFVNPRKKSMKELV